MGRKSTKRTLKRHGLKQLTAIVPKTFKATSNLGKKTLKSINSFLNRTAGVVKTTSNAIDKGAAKAIRSFTKKRGRK
jgi:hypothetical protein